MKKTISLYSAIESKILAMREKPVIHEYEYIRHVAELYRNRTYLGSTIQKISSPYPEKYILSRHLQGLINNGVLNQIGSLPIYSFSGTQTSAQQIICTLNPFSYLSHLSAMEWHHMTDRIPHAIHLITCSQRQFKTLADKLASKDFPSLERVSGETFTYQDIPGVPITHQKINAKKIMKYTIHEHSRKTFRNMPTQQGSGGIRVASVGQTFLDMLKEPDFCGGINHVLEVFEEHAERYLSLIIRATDKQGSTIDKMRVGYLLEERFGLAKNNPTIEGWKTSAQRGGSRVLVAGEPYANTFSETWCLSINLPDGN